MRIQEGKRVIYEGFAVMSGVPTGTEGVICKGSFGLYNDPSHHLVAVTWKGIGRIGVPVKELRAA